MTSSRDLVPRKTRRSHAARAERVDLAQPRDRARDTNGMETPDSTPAHRTLDPTLDVVFKLLLTTGPDSEELLCALLTAVLRPKSPIATVTVLNPEIPGEDVLKRWVVLDLRARLEDGTSLDIEMHAQKRGNFRDRALFYWARLYTSELDRGERYDVLHPAIGVHFLDYVELDGQRVHSTFTLLEVHDHERFSRAIELHIVELPKLSRVTPAEQQAEADLVDWVRFFKARTDEERTVLAMHNPTMDKAKQALDRVSADPTAQELARLAENARVTQRLELSAAYTEGREVGREEGLDQGRAQGLEQGLELGLEQGLEQGRAQGLEQGVRRSVESICEVLAIPLDMARREHLAALDLAGLQALQQALLRDRSWPE